MRSSSVAWLLDLAGFTVYLLQHGYKDYRGFTRVQFEKKYPLVVLGGLTGSGKTEILQQLVRLGEQVIDLEKLARHKGSSFGIIGQPPQGSIEQFENDLALALYQQNSNQHIWLEDEGLSIGRVNIPMPFYEQMQAATFIQLEIPTAARIQKLTQEYCQTNPALLTEAILRIKKRLGGLATKEALQAIAADDMEKMVEIALVYYDKAYGYQLAGKTSQNKITISLPTTNAPENAQHILEVLKQKQVAINE
jgi:tRNA 2-selenouridine synthase